MSTSAEIPNVSYQCGVSMLKDIVLASVLIV